MLQHLPNLITYARMIIGITGALCLYSSHSSTSEPVALFYGSWALFLLIVGIFSDWLDGWVARYLNIVSQLGALLDPIADKVLVHAYFLAFVIITDFDLWLATPVVFILFRDVLLTLKRIRDPGSPALSVSQDAKLKTGLQFLLIAFPFICFAFGYVDIVAWYPYWLGGVWFVSLLSVFTLWHYLKALNVQGKQSP